MKLGLFEFDRIKRLGASEKELATKPPISFYAYLKEKRLSEPKIKAETESL